jgi:adenosine deaminase
MDPKLDRTAIREFIRRMPKAELHLHMEGAVQPSTWLKLAERNGIRLPADTPEALNEVFRFRDFNHFIELYTLCCSCLVNADDFRLATYELLEDLAEQNVRYAEIFMSPTLHLARGVKWETIMEGVSAARREGERDFGIQTAFIPDISRELGPEKGLAVAKHVSKSAEYGVIGLGIGGPEIGFPPDDYWESYDLIGEAGMHRVAHAGETMGPESIWGALKALNAERIGHGVRCLEDEELVEYLRQNQIALEVCPTSNVCTGVTPDWPSHPLKRLMDAGLLVTLNSDDPGMFNTTLTEEFLRAQETFDLTLDEIKNLTLNALRASFLEPASKAKRIAEFEVEFERLCGELVPA